MTAILGISAFYHDSAAALVVDGRIVAAAQEERFTRKKYDAGFPVRSIEFCLRHAGLAAEDLDYVGFYDKPLLKFERLLETYLAYAPAGFRSFLTALPIWLRQKLHLPREMRRELGHKYQRRFVFAEHHESHAASAFFPSPFDEAAILTLDGVGEWATATWGVGQGNRLEIRQQQRFPHSLGLLYSAFTYYTGFAVNSGEYKLMGLAPYGEPKYVDLILDRLIDLKDDGSFRMDMSYFNYCQGLTMTSEKFHRLFGGPPRQPDSPLTRRDMDVAASVQKVTEEIMLRSARYVHSQTGMRNLCLAGGVALNCVANGRILREGPFDNIWIQPAAGDAGGALGVALFIWHQLLGEPRTATPSDAQRGSLLGPSFSDHQIKRFLDSVNARYAHFSDDQQLCEHIADRLADGNVVGWFQGAMEFGPRALGSRSLLGDPRNPDMQTVMNVKVKFREGFRPFAPAVLAEHSHEFFGIDPATESPYMLLVAPVQEEKRCPLAPEDAAREGIDKLKTRRSVVPAITHVDYSARIQTVDLDRHGLYHGVLDAFYRKTGCPVLVNTSFNLSWEPIVCTPREAYHTFMASGIDVLCLGRFVLTKAEQRCYVPPELAGRPDAQLADIWCSPNAQGELQIDENQIRCVSSGDAFAIEVGIPQLVWPRGVSNSPKIIPLPSGEGGGEGKIPLSSKPSPYPLPRGEGFKIASNDYQEIDSLRALIEHMRQDEFARLLDDSIAFNTDVLEVGCGTGRLTNFLGISCRRVIGTDTCLASLQHAERFRRAHALHRIRFVQMNLYQPCFRPESFDVVIAGALDHTADPRGGLASAARLVRPGGYVVLGWRNRFWGLIPKYGSKHSVGEVQKWFDRCGLSFVRSFPSLGADDGDSAGENLFAPARAGSAIDRLLAQARAVFAGRRSDGTIYLIGHKPPQIGTQPPATKQSSKDDVAGADALATTRP